MYFSTIIGGNIDSKGIILSNDFRGTYMIVSNSISTTRINFDTIEGALINTSSVSTTYMSFDTIEGSLINTSTLSTNTISTNMFTTNELIFSSLCMIPSTISSVIPPVNGFSSSILICLDGSYWQIPIFPV